MGLCLESTEEMGDYSVELRSGTFYLRGADDYAHVFDGAERPDQSLILYPRVLPEATQRGVSYNDISRTGTVEIRIADIPKIRAALNLIEQQLAEDGRLAQIYAPQDEA